MSSPSTMIYLARHGDTEWTSTGQHTGRTDIALTLQGEEQAKTLVARLNGISFAKVLYSPLKRAKRTCELAGFGAIASAEPDLMEWDYGKYEARRTADIRSIRPDWQLFRDGCPEGESVDAIGSRADRVLVKIGHLRGNALLFAHGHILRVLTARWLGLDANAGRLFVLNTASLSILGYEHNAEEPVIRLWNDVSHLGK